MLSYFGSVLYWFVIIFSMIGVPLGMPFILLAEKLGWGLVFGTFALVCFFTALANVLWEMETKQAR